VITSATGGRSDRARSTASKAYSPECVEGAFSEVHIQHRSQLAPIATQGLQPLRPTVPSIAADHQRREPTSVNAVDQPLSNKRYRTRRAKSVFQDTVCYTTHTPMP
jgi:hypothetical protein